MQISFLKILFYLLVTIPVTFKLELYTDVYVYPQELLLPVVILLVIFSKKKIRIPYFILPYLILLAGLLVILISTFFSQLSYFNLIGIAKSLKYIMYIIAILLLSNYNFNGFLKTFNRIAFGVILITLVVYVYQFLTFPGSSRAFFHATTWVVEYVPSGLSNVVLKLQELSFIRSGGNHNIYGTYLVLIYILNLKNILGYGSNPSRLNYILVFLTVLSLLLITSREAFLVFIIVNFLFFLGSLLKLKIKKVYFYLFLLVIVGVFFSLIFNLNVGLLNKLEYTIQSFSETGGETNLNLRLQVWHLILLSILMFPFIFFFGIGYNEENFLYYLNQVNQQYGLYSRFPSNPESLFFTFLAYGGIIAFLLLIVYWILIFINLFKLQKKSVTAKLFFFLTIGLFIANNTGGSMLSDLLLTQYALVYIWIKKDHLENPQLI